MKLKQLLIPVLLMALSLTACAATMAPPRARNFVEFLAARQDLVVAGVVLEAVEVRHQPEETCGVRGLMPLPMTEVRLRVERVFSGVVESPDLTILVDGHKVFSNGSGINTRVIVWGNRSCDDNWRLYCRLAVIHPDGQIAKPDGSPLMKSAEGQAIAAVSIDELTRPGSKFESQSTNLFEGSVAVALARRIDTNGWTATGAVFQLESLGWVTGAGTNVPKFLSFPRLHGCYPDIYSGDSLLVPIPATFGASDTMFIDKCPSALRVKHGFAPGLGVRIDSPRLQEALDRTASTVHVRRILQEDR